MREVRERTKFDKWLDARKIGREPIQLVLEFSPVNPEELEIVTARVTEVDRYMIQVQFLDPVSVTDEEYWWIPKDSIKGAARTENENATGGTL